MIFYIGQGHVRTIVPDMPLIFLRACVYRTDDLLLRRRLEIHEADEEKEKCVFSGKLGLIFDTLGTCACRCDCGILDEGAGWLRTGK